MAQWWNESERSYRRLCLANKLRYDGNRCHTIHAKVNENLLGERKKREWFRRATQQQRLAGLALWSRFLFFKHDNTYKISIKPNWPPKITETEKEL